MRPTVAATIGARDAGAVEASADGRDGGTAYGPYRTAVIEIPIFDRALTGDTIKKHYAAR